MLEVTPGQKYNILMKRIFDNFDGDLLSDPSVAVFDGKMKELLMDSDMLLLMADRGSGEGTVNLNGQDIHYSQNGASQPRPKNRRRKGKNPLDNNDMPLSEMFKLLNPDSRQALMNQINRQAADGKLDDIMQNIPEAILNKIDSQILDEEFMLRDGLMPVGDNRVQGRDRVMKWLSDFDNVLSRMTTGYDHNILMKFEKDLRDLLGGLDLDLEMANVLGNVVNMTNCDLLDFTASLSGLTDDSRNNVLDKIRKALDEKFSLLVLDDWPQVEDKKFSGGKDRGGGRPVTVDDVMDVLTGKDTLSDEFKCEIERFVIDQALLDEDVLKLIPVDYSVPMHNVVRMNISITPMMTFAKLEDSPPALLTDNFLIDKISETKPQHLIMQLQQVEPFRPDGFVNFNVIDGNAAVIAALEYKKMNSVVGKPLNDFLAHEEMSELLNHKIEKFVKDLEDSIEHSSMGDKPKIEIDAAEVELDMKTKTGATIRVKADIRVDPEQCTVTDDMSSGIKVVRKLYYPVVTMKLVKRPIWELVQNGPMLITKREGRDRAARRTSQEDEVVYANEVAKSMMGCYKHLPVPFFTTTTTHETSCCLGVAEATERMPKPLAELKGKFDQYYLNDEYPTYDLNMRLGGREMHAILSPLTDDKANLSTGISQFGGVLCDCSGSVIVATDMKGRVVDMNNEATAKLMSDSCEDAAQEHLGRHFTRYINPLDRKLVNEQFAACLKSGNPKAFDKMIVMTSCDLSFATGNATYDLTLRLQLYPHFDKYGKIAGIVFEGREVSLIKLEADAARHIFGHDSEPLVYNMVQSQYDVLLEGAYNMTEDQLHDESGQKGCKSLRKAHAPLFGLSTTGTVEKVTHAALKQLSTEDKKYKQVDILNLPFIDWVADRSLNEFKILCERVKADPEVPQVADMFIRGKEIPVQIYVSTWYNSRAEPQGLLVNMCGFLAAFEMDSDGYVLDCTPAAAQALGYTRSEILQTALMNYVDAESSGDALQVGQSLLDDDFTLDENMVVRINMRRKTKRIIQTTWDAVRLDKDKLLVIMHEEKLTNKIRDKAAQMQNLDMHEELLVDRLKRMVPVKYHKELEDQKEDVELSPVERAMQQKEPVKYHYAVMQKHGDIKKTCDAKDFAKYLGAVWQEQRPWELHRLNVYRKSTVEKVFLKISRNHDEMEFSDWETWWNKSDNRKDWDGGSTMVHVDPPGCKDPYDYDRS